MPTHLDRLFRFFRHDEGKSTVAWNVSAVTLEQKSRLYRYSYKSTERSFEQEITISVRTPRQLLPFYTLLARMVHEKELDEAFRSACSELLVIDPWLEELQRDFTEIPPLAETSSAVASLT
jgi:hypothetical protein